MSKHGPSYHPSHKPFKRDPRLHQSNFSSVENIAAHNRAARDLSAMLGIRLPYLNREGPRS